MNIISNFISPKYGVFAIHGGNIEPGTSEVAKIVAGDNYSLYIYEGESFSDHITSTKFKEEQADILLNKIQTVISVHELRDKSESYVMLGGLDFRLIDSIGKNLIDSGFQTKNPPENLDGDNENNICNRGISKKGAQIEISQKLMKELMVDKDLLNNFVQSIRQSLV